MSASLAVQRMIHAALTSAPGLAELSGVFDGVPADAAAPYLTLGPDLVSDWSHKTGIGHEHRVQLTVWDDRAGMARVKSMAGAARGGPARARRRARRPPDRVDPVPP